MDEAIETATCGACGAEVEAGAELCSECGAPAGGRATGKQGKRRRKLPGPAIEPWAVKAGEAVRRIPTWVKIVVPCSIVAVVGIVVALLVIAGGHSPSASVEKYLSNLQKGEYRDAFDLTVNQGGRFSTFGYFEAWQSSQAEELGQLEDYMVQPRKQENRIFGRLVLEEQASGDPFTASLTYADKSFDVNITAEGAGGTWPFKKYRLRLSEQPTGILAKPLGAKIYIDGVLAGSSSPDTALQDAISLKDFPGDIEGAIDYVKRLRSAVEGYIDSARSILRGLGVVEDQVQRSFNKLGQGGVSWSQLLESLKRTASAGRDVGEEIARMFIHLYWTFGGSDDGTLRAELSRTEPGLEIAALPEGFHRIKVEQADCRPQTRDFYAPEDVTLEMKPRPKVVSELETAVEGYYRERSVAEYTLNNAALPTVIGGPLLEEENAKVLELATRGQKVASQLVSVKYKDAKVLAPDVASLEAEEVWNFTTYESANPISVLTNVKQKAVYTLKRNRAGTWKAIERVEKK